MAEYRLSYTGEQVDALLGQINSAIPITYSQLKNLRDGGRLAPGKFYRITDYVTTTSDAESRSVGHQFDIIVLALDESHLSEESYAAHHAGDSYFANSKLEAWRLMYCLDNDLIRFTWADTTNGRGVIYRMIDEFYNDVPYDFKNIQFKRYAITANSGFTESLGRLNGLRIGHQATYGCTINTSSYYWYYTFSSLGDTWDSATDASLDGSSFNNYFIPYSMTGMNLLNMVFANGPVIGNFLQTNGISTSAYNSTQRCYQINSKETHNISCFGLCNSNIFDGNFADQLFFGELRHNSFYNDCKHLTLVGSFVGNECLFTSCVIYVNDGFYNCTISWMNECYIYCKQVNELYAERFFNSNIHCPDKNVTYNHFAYVRLADFNDAISYSDFGYNIHDVVFDGPVTSCRIGNQLRYANIQANLTMCDFGDAVEYIDIPAVSGKMFTMIRICTLRGTSSSRIKLGNENFYLDSISGLKRTIQIESGNGEVVATWKGTHGVVQGVYATPAESQAGTWHTI